MRLMLHPSKKSPRIPKGVTVEVAVCSLNDERGMRAAMKDVSTIYHLASAESKGSRANLMQVDIEGASTISRIGKEANVKRIFYLSHLGADRASAFPLLKAKGVAEDFIKNSGIPYTIIRSAFIYGENDHFTENLARLICLAPGFMYVPGEGNTLLQPIWVDDLIASLIWALDLPLTINQTIEVGGPEFLSIKEILLIIMQKISKKRSLFPISPIYLNIMTELFETFSSKFPTSVFWIDYLAENRICDLDTLPRVFGINPSRFTHRIDYLTHSKKKVQSGYSKSD